MTLIKLKNNWGLRLLLLAFVVVLLLSPVGGKIKTYAGRFMAANSVKGKLGEQVPLAAYEWELLDLEGNTLQFKSKKGTVVLLNFWATWCAPCIAEMPSLQQLYNDYGDKVSFMFVTNDDPSKVNAFLEKRSLELPVYYPNSPEPNVFSSKLLPTTYIVNEEGKIVVVETGAVDWNSEATRKLLDELLLN
ncbi:TlpA family protein disulfide reductase [Arenibacter lacus]|uniref:TlpA family protein disulfide reductase n=1 Tax=Arenibacter lacus TaxID=2608629 RepID=UPI00123DDA7A|nr:TlpA disulfide reductase family protein [Arenibacter lacus]